MMPDKRGNPVLACLLVPCAAALYGLPFLQVAPNRLVSGQPVYFFAIAPEPVAWMAIALLCVLLLLAVKCLVKPSRLSLWAALAMAVVLMPTLLYAAASQASLSLQNESPIARASLASAFWLALALLGLAISSALEQLRASTSLSAVVGLLPLLALSTLVASGVCADVSLVKEFNNRADGLGQVIARHLQIVGLALAFTLALGLPLAWASHARPAVGRAVFPVLNIIQTIPSIALFGLLMLPLALLAARLPALGQLGISGVGLAPAVIALALYGLLPVVRSTLVGLQQVPAAMVQAAQALGLTRWQVLRLVELPLALPVMLGGVRTAAVATVGLAAVSALIGAGGLGSVLFEGLFANAQDVVLLGVLPIIALGVSTDLLFKALSAWARPGPQPQ